MPMNISASHYADGDGRWFCIGGQAGRHPARRRELRIFRAHDPYRQVLPPYLHLLGCAHASKLHAHTHGNAADSTASHAMPDAVNFTQRTSVGVAGPLPLAYAPSFARINVLLRCAAGIWRRHKTNRSKVK